MELKNIKIPEEVWWKLNELKVKWRLKKISEVIERFVKENKK